MRWGFVLRHDSQDEGTGLPICLSVCLSAFLYALRFFPVVRFWLVIGVRLSVCVIDGRFGFFFFGSGGALGRQACISWGQRVRKRTVDRRYERRIRPQLWRKPKIGHSICTLFRAWPYRGFGACYPVFLYPSTASFVVVENCGIFLLRCMSAA